MIFQDFWVLCISFQFSQFSFYFRLFLCHHIVNDQHDQHQHQHQHHMDDDRSQQSESNDRHYLDEEPTYIAAATRSNSFIALPSAVLEHILIHLPFSYIGLLPMLCKSLHSEIGTQSPALWRNVILREGWTEPKNVPADSMTLYKSFFLSHDRICQRVEALKMGVTKLLNPDKDVKVSKGIALGAIDRYQNDLDPSEMYMQVWDNHSVLIVSQNWNDCVVRLYQVSTQTSSDDKCVRKIMQVRLAPVPITEEIDCTTLTMMAIDDRYVVFAFDVYYYFDVTDGGGENFFSILASIMKDDLLSNSTEHTIECGDCLKKHELPLMVKDLYDRNPDHNHLRFLSDLLERQNFENEMRFDVIDLIDVGHGIFCILVSIYHRYSERNEEGFHIEQDLMGDALLSFSASNEGGRIFDCIQIPESGTNDVIGSLSSNMEWTHRSNPVEITCEYSFDNRTLKTMAVNIDRSGVFHRTRVMIQYRSPTNFCSSHTLKTPSRLVRYLEGKGVLDVYNTEDDLPSENLPLKAEFNTEFHTLLSMNHLGNDYVMMTRQRDAISVPADEDIDDQRNVYCLYFIVIHIPSMEEICVSRITSIEKVNVMVTIGKDCTIVAAVLGKGCCFSSPHV